LYLIPREFFLQEIGPQSKIARKSLKWSRGNACVKLGTGTGSKDFGEAQFVANNTHLGPIQFMNTDSKHLTNNIKNCIQKTLKLDNPN
jgi:hypothetical protein